MSSQLILNIPLAGASANTARGLGGAELALNPRVIEILFPRRSSIWGTESLRYAIAAPAALRIAIRAFEA
jgi:hypothetical protein